MSIEISAWRHKIAIHATNDSYLNTFFSGPPSFSDRTLVMTASKHLHFTKYHSAFKKCIISIFLSCKTNENSKLIIRYEK